MTKSDWPVLVNLSRTTQVGYQQIAKFDPRTRIVASAWEEEYTLAECADGDQARALISRIAEALASGEKLLDLRRVDLGQLTDRGGAAR
jgi:tRNA U55 pseudouridine synthase TruB